MSDRAELPLLPFPSKYASQKRLRNHDQGTGSINPPSRGKDTEEASVRETFVAISMWEASLHLTSVAFTVIVLTLCHRRIYFMDITKPNVNSMLNAFQFVAALHGAIIAISLGSMASYHLLTNLLMTKDGATFGHIVATFQVRSGMGLISPTFWRSTFGKTPTTRTVVFSLFLFITSCLVLLIPPFSAVLIVPQLQWWRMTDPFSGTGGFFYLNSSSDQMWPSHITAAMINND